MKESYVPGIFERSLLDEKVKILDEDAFETARRLLRDEGIFAGMSSGWPCTWLSRRQRSWTTA